MNTDQKLNKLWRRLEIDECFSLHNGVCLGWGGLQLENVELNSNLLNSRPNTTHRHVLAFHATFKTIVFISLKVLFGYSDIPLIARLWVEIGGEARTMFTTSKSRSSEWTSTYMINSCKKEKIGSDAPSPDVRARAS